MDVLVDDDNMTGNEIFICGWACSNAVAFGTTESARFGTRSEVEVRGGCVGSGGKCRCCGGHTPLLWWQRRWWCSLVGVGGGGFTGLVSRLGDAG